MTKYAAIRIPFQIDEPVEKVEYDDEKRDQLSELVFGTSDDSLPLGYASFRTKGVQMFFDDLGLFRQPTATNLRAMELWAALAGRRFSEFRQPLVGDYVVLGMTEWDGETADVHEKIVEFALSMNSHIKESASDG